LLRRGLATDDGRADLPRAGPDAGNERRLEATWSEEAPDPEETALFLPDCLGLLHARPPVYPEQVRPAGPTNRRQLRRTECAAADGFFLVMIVAFQQPNWTAPLYVMLACISLYAYIV
jgi:hypothetical protein